MFFPHFNFFFSATPSSLDNYYTIIDDPSQKLALLVDFVKKAQKCIVFFSTCACVEYFSVCLERLLKDRKIFSIHGKKGQKRHKVFDAFKQTDEGLLLCTGKKLLFLVPISTIAHSGPKNLKKFRQKNSCNQKNPFFVKLHF